MKRRQRKLLLLFPSAVLTASGSKGISQRKAPLKFFVKLDYFFEKKKRSVLEANFARFFSFFHDEAVRSFILISFPDLKDRP
jgi:hypothetical protein